MCRLNGLSQAFLFEDIWPFLKLGQLVGTFPYKKITDEDGTVTLQPMNRCIALIRILLIWLLLLLSCILTTFWILHQEDLPVSHFFEFLTEVYVTGKLSQTGNFFLFVVVIPMGTTVAIYFIYRNYTNKIDEFYIQLTRYELIDF